MYDGVLDSETDCRYKVRAFIQSSAFCAKAALSGALGIPNGLCKNTLFPLGSR